MDFIIKIIYEILFIYGYKYKDESALFNNVEFCRSRVR